jgi:hypothetical protein
MIPFRNNLLLGRHRDKTFTACLLVAVTVAFTAYVVRLSDVTHDAFHEMALARVWWETGRFPVDDVFAFSATVSPTVHHEWGTGLVLFWVSDLGPLGLDGMAILRWVLIVGLALLIYRIARNQGAHPFLLALCAPIVFPVLWVGFANLRAQLFTLVFLAMEILMLQSDARGRRRWILGWAGLYVVWLNMHAGFVVGLALMGSHVSERWGMALLLNERGKWQFPRLLQRSVWRQAFQRYWHHAFLIPITIAGVLINPWGWLYVPYLIRAITLQRSTMLEWQPLWMSYAPALTVFSFGISLLLLLYVAKNRRWSRLGGWWFCGLAAWMAWKHLRHGSLYGVLWLACVPGWLTPTPLGRRAIAWLQNHRNQAMAGAGFLTILCALFTLSHSPWRSTLPKDDPDSLMVYPVEACAFVLENQWEGNMVTPFVSGGYVSWRCYPQIRVSLDGRYEVAYREEVLPAHDRFFAAEPGWENLLNEYEVDLILVQRSAPVGERLQSPENMRRWTLVHQDPAFSLFAKREYLMRANASPPARVE